MQQTVFKYITTKPIEEWNGNRPFISNKVKFVVRYMEGNSSSYLEVVHLGGKESHRCFASSGPNFMDQRLRRREVLEQAAAQFFNAYPTDIYNYFTFDGEDRYTDGKLVYST